MYTNIQDLSKINFIKRCHVCRFLFSLHVEEPTSWSTPFIADRYGHMCPQSGVLINVTHPGYDDYDEDCLYLNVYAPHVSPSNDVTV